MSASVRLGLDGDIARTQARSPGATHTFIDRTTQSMQRREKEKRKKTKSVPQSVLLMECRGGRMESEVIPNVRSSRVSIHIFYPLSYITKLCFVARG